MDNDEQKNENGAMDELAKCREERDQYLAGWQRAKADFQNYKKDEMKRLQDVARYANEELIREFIGVLDNFDLGIRALERSGNVEKGVYMIRTQIEDTMRRYGVERIPSMIGKPFDPEVAEAIGEGDPPDSGGIPPGNVMDEIEPGYRLHDRVLRPARVIVVRQKATGKENNITNVEFNQSTK